MTDKEQKETTKPEEQKEPIQPTEQKQIKPTEQKTKKTYRTIIIVFAIVVGFLILWIVGNFRNSVPDILDETTMNCIADNSQLIALTTCGSCKKQKVWLGNYTSIFDIIYCDLPESENFCIENNVPQVPLWIIKGERHLGVFTPEELKELTGC